MKKLPIFIEVLRDIPGIGLQCGQIVECYNYLVDQLDVDILVRIPREGPDTLTGSNLVEGYTTTSECYIVWRVSSGGEMNWSALSPLELLAETLRD